MANYGIIQNTGVPASRIPFSGRGQGKSKSSKYIEGLKLFARLRFKVGRKEATRIAFAIAAKHKKKGMPTIASKQYSETGRRTGAIQEALQASEREVQQLIDETITLFINGQMVQAFKEGLPQVKVSR